MISPENKKIVLEMLNYQLNVCVTMSKQCVGIQSAEYFMFRIRELKKEINDLTNMS